MNEKHILVVEDEQAISDMIGFSIERAGYSWAAALDAGNAASMISDQRPDLILLDWMLPGVSGVDFAKRLRKDDMTSDIPIIMLTARSNEDDKVRGLEAGADDYICKPFSPRELLARIKAVMRRVNPVSDDEICRVDDLTLDASSHRVTISDKKLEMGPTEFRLLHFLMTHPERVYSRSQLLDRVWGGNVYIEDRTVDVHIRRLRKVLSEYQYDQYIQTVRGAGYRFSIQV